jgi:Tol biopolymer transport system component
MRLLSVYVLILVLFAHSPANTVRGSEGEVVRLSVSASGIEGDKSSGRVKLIASGRRGVFGSDATNLVDGDVNNYNDVFLKDIATGRVVLASVAADGTQGNANSGRGMICFNGRRTVFHSGASNLVDDDTNRVADVFIRDLPQKSTVRVSVSTDGVQADRDCLDPAISGDGRRVVFYSRSDKLVENDTNKRGDIFLRDLEADRTVRVSVKTGGGQCKGGEGEPAISADGRYVVFLSSADDIVEGDTNLCVDVFLHDYHKTETSRVSLNSDQKQVDDNCWFTTISGDGRIVAFTSTADNIWGYSEKIQVYLRDVEHGDTFAVLNKGNRVLPAEGADRPALSYTGRWVVFESKSNDIVDGDDDDFFDVFIRDTLYKTNSRISVAYDGGPVDGDSRSPSISPNGRFVGFESYASNIVPDDTNGVADAFIYDRGCSDFLRGDSNCDGNIDFDDVEDFLLAMIDPDAYAVKHLTCDWECNNDINRDGKVNFDDIDPFVECLINGGCE